MKRGVLVKKRLVTGKTPDTDISSVTKGFILELELSEGTTFLLSSEALYDKIDMIKGMISYFSRFLAL